MKRTFVRTINPQDNTKILRIPATGGGWKDLRKGVEVDVTSEEAEAVDGLKGVIIRKSRDFQRPVKQPRPVKTPKGSSKGTDKKKEEVKQDGRSDTESPEHIRGSRKASPTRRTDPTADAS